jgi:heme-degrading monooxygenase HmoA
MIAISWRFRPADGLEAQFEAAYGPNGDWARLFRTATGFVRTDLLRAAKGEYLTVDCWRDEAAWNAFLKLHRDSYERLDRSFEALTATEEKLGVYTHLDTP